MIGGMRKIVRTCYWLAGAVAAAALAARSIKAVGVDERYAVLPMVWREARYRPSPALPSVGGQREHIWQRLGGCAQDVDRDLLRRHAFRVLLCHRGGLLLNRASHGRPTVVARARDGATLRPGPP
jgi:hypothetical protein